MPMYWTFDCFLGCIYTVYYIVHIVFLVLNWLSSLEFRLPKKEDQVGRIGVMGGGLGNSGNAQKKTFFYSLMSSLSLKRPFCTCRHFQVLNSTWAAYGKRLIPGGERGSSSRQGDANKRRQPHGLLLDPCRWQYHVQLVPNLGIVFNWSPLDYQKATAE